MNFAPNDMAGTQTPTTATMNPAEVEQGPPNAMEHVRDMNGHSPMNAGVSSTPAPVQDTANRSGLTRPAGIASTNVQDAIEEVNSRMMQESGPGAPSGKFTFNTRTGEVVITNDEAPDGAPADTVINVAALRAVNRTGVTVMSTRGYYTARDGGGATYYLDPADVDSPDDGGAVIVANNGGRWKLVTGGNYSARQFGARGNSTISFAGADDTVALQRFINFLSTGGYKGYLPGGRYRITRRLDMPDTCALFGDGWKDVRDITGYNTRDWAASEVYGTIIYADYVDTSPEKSAVLYVTGNSCIIEDMEFECLQPYPADNWASNETPTAIWCFRDEYAEQGGNGIVLRNLMIRNFKHGVRMFGAARGTIDGLFGQCFGNFIDITANYDVVRIEHLHANFPFFSGHPAVFRHLGENAVGIVFGRSDNPIWSDIFIFYARTGIRFYTDTTPTGGFEGGITQRLQITNLGIDLCNTGLYATDALRLSIANFYVLCRSDPTESFNNESRCFHSARALGGGYVPLSLNLVNGDFGGAALEALRFEVPGVINLSNVVIRNFGLANTGVPGISVGDGVRVFAANVGLEEANAAPMYQTFGTGTYSDAHSPSGEGGAAGVRSFNNRTGAVILTGDDIVGAIASATAPVSTAATIRATGRTVPAGGAGTELAYDPDASAGYLMAYDRSAGQYRDLTIAGSNLTFRAGSGDVAASFDTNGALLLAYPASNGLRYRLQVNGQIYTTSALIATSDRRVMRNVTPLQNALADIMTLKPVSYSFVPHPIHHFPKGTHIGFLAQDLEQSLRNVDYGDAIVATGDDGLKGLAEVKLVPLLVKALQELNDKFEAYVKLHP
ncbi:MAG TPA: tail fiber domain-containing protein [Telluria sp.]|jgi:hypothetical protein